MMKRLTKLKARFMSLLLAGGLLLDGAAPAAAAEAEYASGTINGHATKYVTIDMSEARAEVMLANGDINSAQSLAGMAAANGAFAAINGTYFSAYDGNPIPWGTVMQNGELLHTGGGAIVGITADGRLIIDRLTFKLNGYINGEEKFNPWRINHAIDTNKAITLYTDEFGGTITPAAGAKTVMIDSANKVTGVVDGAFTVPAGGMAVVFNKGIEQRASEYFAIGDTVTYDATFETTYTQPADWQDVQQALGAGPSLIINGTVTADGLAEGFTEDKINTDRAGRSFLGATADGTIRIGNIGSATLKEAAAVCQQLGLVNAMCLDGGGSIALYYYGGAKTSGRDINNALGFFERPIMVYLDGRALSFDVDPTVISSTTMVPLRGIFEALDATVNWNAADKDLTAQLNGSDTSIYLKLGSTDMQITSGGATRTVTLQTPVLSLDGRVLVPLRAISEAFGCDVGWDGAARTVNITTTA